MQISVSRLIDAPADLVFGTVSDIRNYATAIPHIIGFEFLSETRSGVGTRFRETRLMQGKEMATELEITEFVDNDCVRMVADSHGTIWDTLFAVAPKDDATELSVTMDARSHAFLPKLMVPLMKSRIGSAVEKDMDLVKAYCESECRDGRARGQG